LLTNTKHITVAGAALDLISLMLTHQLPDYPFVFKLNFIMKLITKKSTAPIGYKFRRVLWRG
jgi:hypothetical protein